MGCSRSLQGVGCSCPGPAEAALARTLPLRPCTVGAAELYVNPFMLDQVLLFIFGSVVLYATPLTFDQVLLYIFGLRPRRSREWRPSI